MRLIQRSSRRTPVAAAALVFAVMLLAVGAPLAAQTVATTFGSGDSCEFQDLEAAVQSLLTLPADERIVKLERGLYQGIAISAETDQLTLQGGFDSCDAEQPTPNARSILLGTPDDPVIFHQGLSSPQAGDPPSLRVSQVELGESGDGGLAISGPARVFLENVLILGNTGRVGAGIAIQAFTGFVDLRLDRTSVNGNQTTLDFAEPNGGGLFCNGSSVVQVGPGSAFVGNKAVGPGRGGGIYLKGCFLLATGDVNISLNQAHRGGGIAITNDGTAQLRSNAEGTVKVRLNHATERDGEAGRGGGLYVDEASSLRVHAAQIEQNRALPVVGVGEQVGAGGGVFVDGAEALLVEQSDSCESPCLSLSANEAGRGAALMATAGSQTEVVRAIVDANVGESSIFEAEDGAGTSSHVFVMSSFVSRNVAPTLLRVRDNSTLRLVHSSVGGNLGVDQAVLANDLSSFSLTSSLVFEPSANFLFNLGDGVAVSAECSLVSDDAFLGGSPSVVEEDPLFRDAQTGDLHLLGISPAIDLCSVTPGLDTDIDGQPRPVDQEVVPDNGKPADAGADEVAFIEPVDPFVFADGFESGDLSAWSGSGGTARFTTEP